MDRASLFVSYQKRILSAGWIFGYGFQNATRYQIVLQYKRIDNPKVFSFLPIIRFIKIDEFQPVRFFHPSMPLGSSIFLKIFILSSPEVLQKNYFFIFHPFIPRIFSKYFFFLIFILSSLTLLKNN